MHHLVYGSSELCGDQLWDGVRLAELSQAQAAIFENDNDPLATWEDGEEVHGIIKFELDDLPGWGILTRPETVKTCLAD